MFSIKKVIERMEEINTLRMKRTLSFKEKKFSCLYKLLPIFLHYRNSFLFGGIGEDAPYGIFSFSPDSFQKQWMKEFDFFRNFYRMEGNFFPISGIYSMGSTSSIGQNYNSDLDIWVFCCSGLKKKEKILLRKKCNLIEKWFFSHGLKVTLFLVEEKDFLCFSSSCQETDKKIEKMLLLDEFYRTSVRIAGKKLLWMLIPLKIKKNYQEYVSFLHDKGCLRLSEWLDLGNICSFFFRNNVFLLKLLKPDRSLSYKLFLKNILLEAYFSHLSKSHGLLSMEFKSCLHSGKNIAYGLDSYCMMLKRVTEYLQTIQDTKRLSVFRLCFFFKICGGSFQDLFCVRRIGWKKKILLDIVSSWKWNENYIRKIEKFYGLNCEELYFLS